MDFTKEEAQLFLDTLRNTQLTQTVTVGHVIDGKAEAPTLPDNIKEVHAKLVAIIDSPVEAEIVNA